MDERRCGGQGIRIGRWTTIFASILIMAGAGTTQLFAIYSRSVKKTLNCNLSTLNTISVFKDVGANISVIAGLFFKVTPFYIVLLIGSTANLVGNLLLWLSVTERISESSWKISLYSMIGASYESFANTVSLETCVKVFPNNHLKIWRVINGYKAIGSNILLQIFLAMYEKENYAIFLFLAILPTVLSILSVYGVHKKKVLNQENEELVRFFLQLSAILAGGLMALNFVQRFIKIPKHTLQISTIIIWTVLLCLLLFWSIRQDKKENNNAKQMAPSDIRVEESKVGEVLEAFSTLEMFLILLITVLGSAASLTTVDNMGVISESLQYDSNANNELVSLFSLSSFFGRILSSFMSELLFKKYKVPPTVILTTVLCFSCPGFILVAYPFNGSLYGASIMIGFTFGAQRMLLSRVVSDLFGPKIRSTLIQSVHAVIPLATFLFKTVLTGRGYDEEAKRLMDLVLDATHMEHVSLQKKTLSCVGSTCFEFSFKVLTGSSFFTSLVSLVLLWRTWKMYRGT